MGSVSLTGRLRGSHVGGVWRARGSGAGAAVDFSLLEHAAMAASARAPASAASARARPGGRARGAGRGLNIVTVLPGTESERCRVVHREHAGDEAVDDPADDDGQEKDDAGFHE